MISFLASYIPGGLFEASPAPDAPSFHLFPQLPTEIRLKIWSFASRRPRVIAIHRKANTLHSSSFQPLTIAKYNARAHRDFETWVTDDAIPAVLHVCRESRVEALKHYSLAFGAPAVYFDFSCDTLRFGYGKGDVYLRRERKWLKAGPMEIAMLAHEMLPDLDKVQRLVIDVGEGSFHYHIREYLSKFNSLRELRIINWNSSRGMVYYQDALDLSKLLQPEWQIPDVDLWDAKEGRSWGSLRLARDYKRVS